MAAYKLGIGGVIIRLADGASIPPDPRNSDYREYLAWVAGGGTPDAADPPLPPLPARYCDPGDLIRLLTANELRAIEAATAASDAAKLFWERFRVRTRRIDTHDADFQTARAVFAGIIGEPRATQILDAWLATATQTRAP